VDTADIRGLTSPARQGLPYLVPSEEYNLEAKPGDIHLRAFYLSSSSFESSKMCKNLSSFAFAVLCIQSLSGPALADDWTRFRGVSGTGISDSTTLPTTRSDIENIA